jgi:dGTPase
VVTKLEQRYPDFPGLNLTYETREGMIKHETDYDRSDASEYEPHRRASLEAQIANLADEMAYNAHDLDDGLRAALFPLHDLNELAIWRELKEKVGWRDEKDFTPVVRHEVIRELIGWSVGDVLRCTNEKLSTEKINTPEKVQLHDCNVVSYSPEFGAKIKALKKFLYERMYRHYRLVRMQEKAERFISEIFNAYVKEPEMLPTAVQSRLAETELRRAITDYIAGMTDRYALDEWQKLFDPYRLV